MDPRIPDKYEMFEFEISDQEQLKQVDWYVNDVHVGSTAGPTYHWQVRRGNYSAYARVYTKNQPEAVVTNKVSYTVK